MTRFEIWEGDEEALVSLTIRMNEAPKALSMIEEEKKGSIVVLNAGGQYCHLIARRVREAGVRSIIREGKVALKDLVGAKGIIISGGPNSVYEPDAPQISENIFKRMDIYWFVLCPIFSSHLARRCLRADIGVWRSME